MQPTTNFIIKKKRSKKFYARQHQHALLCTKQSGRQNRNAFGFVKEKGKMPNHWQ